MGASIRRGLAAGLLAGLLAGFFALLVGEIPLREAIELEEQADAAHAGSAVEDDTQDSGSHHGAAGADPLVDRRTQQALLPVATALVGTVLGGLFGICYALVRSRLRETDPWRASLRLGAVAWLAAALFPALAHPASPPGAGDPGSAGARPAWFMAAIALAGLVAFGLWRAAGYLRSRGVPEIPRQVLLAVTGAAAYGGLWWTLPAGSPVAGVPAGLVWEFRLASMATQLILWAGLAAGFGWLCRRAATGQDLGGERPPASSLGAP